MTKAATCAAEGVKTFTCSCGDTYTEKVAATAHKWGEWKQTTAPSYTAMGKETRTCSGCSKKETRDVAQLSLDKLFEEYMEYMYRFPWRGRYFDSTDKLTPENIVEWIDGGRTPVESVQGNRDVEIEINGRKDTMLARDYKVADIDAFTTSVFGRTYDFTKMNLQYYDGSHWFQYDAKNKTVTIFMWGGAGGPTPEPIYRGYTQIDDTHFVITYDTRYYWSDELEDEGLTIEVELINGKYIIVAHRKP